MFKLIKLYNTKTMKKTDTMTGRMTDWKAYEEEISKDIDSIWGWILGVLVIGVIFCLFIGVAYASGGVETQPVNTNDIQIVNPEAPKVCKQDCQIRYVPETWCNTLTEDNTCEYIKVE